MSVANPPVISYLPGLANSNQPSRSTCLVCTAPGASATLTGCKKGSEGPCEGHARRRNASKVHGVAGVSHGDILVYIARSEAELVISRPSVGSPCARHLAVCDDAAKRAPCVKRTARGPALRRRIVTSTERGFTE